MSNTVERAYSDALVEDIATELAITTEESARRLLATLSEGIKSGGIRHIDGAAHVVRTLA